MIARSGSACALLVALALVVWPAPAAAQRVLARIALDLRWGQTQPCVRLFVDESTFLVLAIDTAAPTSILKSSVADRLRAAGLLRLRHGWLVTHAGNGATRPRYGVWPNRLNLGRGLAADFKFYPMGVGSDMRNYPDIDGVLGSDNLLDHALMFDFPNRELVVYASGGFGARKLARLGFGGAPAGTLPDNMLHVDRAPATAHLWVSGVDLGGAAVDTGSGETVVRHDRSVRSAGPVFGEPWHTNSLGWRGTFRRIWVTDIRFCGLLERGGLVLCPVGTATPAGNLVGMDLLRRGRLLCDYPARLAYFRADPAGRRRPTPRALSVPVAAPDVRLAVMPAAFPDGERGVLRLDSTTPYSWVTRAPRCARRSRADSWIASPGRWPVAETSVSVRGRPLLGGAAIRFYVWNPAPRADGDPIKICLGADVLDRYAVTLDPGNSRIELTLGGHVSVMPGAHQIPLRFDASGYSVVAWIGSAPALLKLAIGEPHSVIWSARVMERAAKSRVYTSVRTGKTFGVRAADAAIGDRRWHGPLFRYEPDAAAAFDGRLGNGLFGSVPVTFDFPAGLIVVGPGHGNDRAGHDVFGVGFLTGDVLDGKLTVTDVIRPSPASAAGIRCGDLILSVNGVPCIASNDDRLWAEFSKPPGSHLMLVVQRPGEKALRRIDLTITPG